MSTVNYIIKIEIIYLSTDPPPPHLLNLNISIIDNRNTVRQTDLHKQINFNLK